MSMEVITKMQLKLKRLNKDRCIINNYVLNLRVLRVVITNNIMYVHMQIDVIYSNTHLYIQMIQELSQIK